MNKTTIFVQRRFNFYLKCQISYFRSCEEKGVLTSFLFLSLSSVPDIASRLHFLFFFLRAGCQYPFITPGEVGRREKKCCIFVVILLNVCKLQCCALPVHHIFWDKTKLNRKLPFPKVITSSVSLKFQILAQNIW